MRWLSVGTYPTGEGPGSGEGIWAVPLDTGTGLLGDPHLAVEAPSPSFLALSPAGDHLYAVSEQSDGSVGAFSVTGADDTAPDVAPRLVPAGVAPSGGADPCHVVARPRELWVSSYSSGTLGVLPLDPSGGLSPTAAAVTFGHAGSGPVLDRQEAPHAHSSLELPGGRFAWVMDLGTDEIRRYRRIAGDVDGTAATTLEADGTAVTFAPGTGPRHAVVHPGGTAFVVGELDSAVHVVRTDPATGGGVPVGSVPACATPSREGVAPLPSHVALGGDGSRLYVGVRGPDVVSTFAVHAEPGSEHATLEHLADTPVGGTWPRHFAVVRADDGSDLVVVANQESASVVVLRMDRRTGAGSLVGQAEIPAPACVVVL